MLLSGITVVGSMLVGAAVVLVVTLESHIREHARRRRECCRQQRSPSSDDVKVKHESDPNTYGIARTCGIGADRMDDGRYTERRILAAQRAVV